MCNELWKQRLLKAGLRHRGTYHVKPQVRPTLAFLNSSGPLLVERATMKHLKLMGFDLDAQRDNKSLADVNQLVEKLARYGEASGMAFADNASLREAKMKTLRVFGCHEGKMVPQQLGPGIADSLKLDRSAGLPNLGKKVDSFTDDLRRSERILWEGKVPDPCMAFRRVQHGDGPSTRLVWGYPASMTILEAKFAPQLIERFLSSSTPMTIGLGKIQVGAKLARIRNSNVRYSIDFSGFDSSVPVGLIEFAFRVLRTHFTSWSDEDERAWDKVVNYFVHTPIMLPDQQIYQKAGGVPSGSFFTQLVDSIISYTVMQYTMIELYGQPAGEDYLLVLGDDSVIGARTYRALDQFSGVLQRFGLKVSYKKSGVSRFGEPVHFLGHTWDTCLPDRPPEEVAKRMAFPEKISGIRNSDLRQVVRILSMLGDSQSAQDIVFSIAPYKGPNLRRRILSLLDLFDARGNLRLMTDLTVVPGWRAHLEEIGMAEPISLESLAHRQPFTSIAS